MPAQPLRAVPGGRVAPAAPRVAFCGHCGKPPADGLVPQVGSRVCIRCNLGLLLDAPAAIAPKANEAFVVVDRALAVCGLSRRAEKVLGVREVDVVDRHVTDLLIPADAESAAGRPHGLSAVLVAATLGSEEPATMVLRPADEFGVRFTARVGPCGPSPGALVVLELG